MARSTVPRVAKWIFFSVLLVIFTGLFLYSWMVVPLDKKLAAREAHNLAERIDSAVMLRAAVIRAASEDLNLTGLNAPGALDAVRRTLRKAFPDFRSLEIFNDEGDLLAMVGDIALSESMRGSVSLHSVQGEGEEKTFSTSFHDDPKGRSFYVEGTHRATGGTPWFTRARFSRDTIERLLTSSKSPLHATLVKARVTDGALTGKDRDSANMSTDWRGNLAWVEAPLSIPGWWLRMENVPRQSDASRLSLKTVALIFLALTLAIFIFWRKSTSKRGFFDKASSSNPTAVGYSQETRPNEATAVQDDQSFPSAAVTHSSFGSENDNSDDFFPNATANELLRAHASLSKTKQHGRKGSSAPVANDVALEQVFASPEFAKEFSEAPIDSIHENSFAVPNSDGVVSNGSASSKVSACDTVLSDAAPAAVSVSAASKDADTGSATERLFPLESELTWAESGESKTGTDPATYDSPGVGDYPANMVSDSAETIPDFLEVQWIEPGEDEAPTRTMPRQVDSHQRA